MFDIYSQPIPFSVLFTVIGLVVGSFLNVVIHRLPIMMEREWRRQCAELQGNPVPVEAGFNLFGPRSRCPNCGHAITSMENIPIISWLLLKGQCRGCKTAISARYPAVEGLTGVLTWFAAWHFGPGWTAAAAIVLLWALVALTFIDLDTQYLPDSITLPLVWLGLLVNLWQIYVPLDEAVIGAMAGYCSLWLVYWGFKVITGKEGMGYGDFKLFAALGAWLGWKLLPMIILFSSIVGVVVGLFMILSRRRGREVPIPFGPYLASAGVLALFWGDTATRVLAS